MKKNDTLNALKGIGCILVVFIHVQFPGVFGQSVIALSRSAVALFFMISGYFLYRDDMDEMIKKMPVKIVRTAKLTVIAFFIYLVWESAVRFVGTGAEKVLAWYTTELFTLKSLAQIIFISYDPVVGHLWFLVALLEAYVLVFVLFKLKHKPNAVIAIIALEIHIVLTAVSNLANWGLEMTIFRSVWFYGLPFLIIGYWIKSREKDLLRIFDTRFLIVGIFVGAALTLCERFFVGNLQIFNGSIIMMTSAFLLAVKYPSGSIFKGLTVLGEKYSTDIYIYHWIVKELLIKVKDLLNIHQIWFSWVSPVAAIAVTFIGIWFLSKVKGVFRIKR